MNSEDKGQVIIVAIIAGVIVLLAVTQGLYSFSKNRSIVDCYKTGAAEACSKELNAP